MSAAPAACGAGAEPVEADEIPQHGRGASEVAGLVHHLLRHDVEPTRNLATFLTSSHEPELQRLLGEYQTHNLVDREQYPGMADLEQHCVRMLARMWQGDPDVAVGGAVTGSSEAALLAGAALLRRWRGSGPPNLVMGAHAHVCWHKFCRYWDVEPRIATARPGRLRLDADSVRELCDENTIGVISVLGSTLDGTYEPVAEIAAALDAIASSGGPDVPVHVDAASGGFVAPFLDPGLEWDFRLARVHSINASGHKYGLCPPGLGWILWRDPESRPDELRFRTNYLGTSRTHHELTFSRPAAPVVAQFYNFLRLGFAGYRSTHQRTRSIARHIARGLSRMGPFRLLGDGSQLPVVAVTSRDGDLELQHLATALARRGWSVPVYPLPADMHHTDVLRIVVRRDMSWSAAEELLCAVGEHVRSSTREGA
ncbi:glutamate decarboxylase [Saccharopolyspora rosea]|uniref:Glutamate decarboxylase n=1 Tax=Saccharopolyspora rosea TaxID=524884 RepID=A0ABW3FZU8_9PSEU